MAAFKFEFSDGAVRPSGLTAQEVGERLELIRKRTGASAIGGLDRAAIVADARSGESPLHRWFDSRNLWDDQKAAEIARLNFAGYIVRSVYVITVLDDGKQHKVRQYYPVYEKEAEPQRSYVPLADVLTNAQWLAKAEEEARISWNQFKEKYHFLKKLKVLFDQGDEIFARPVRVRSRSRRPQPATVRRSKRSTTAAA